MTPRNSTPVTQDYLNMNPLRDNISKIKGLLNLLNLLNAQLRRISKLSIYFSLKLVVC
jgi:hypothetical protein